MIIIRFYQTWLIIGFNNQKKNKKRPKYNKINQNNQKFKSQLNNPKFRNLKKSK
jgi:hypothetical protein